MVSQEIICVIQLLLEKGIITRDEIKAKRHALLNPDPEAVEGSDVQSEGTGSDEGCGGCGESGVPGAEDGGGDPPCSTDPESDVAADGHVPEASADGESDPAPAEGAQCLKVD